jgi:hypothetical protein
LPAIGYLRLCAVCALYMLFFAARWLDAYWIHDGLLIQDC